MKEQIQFLAGFVKTLTDLLVSVAIVLLIVDIVWPDAGLPIVENIGAMVEGMSRDGLTGVIALLLFLYFYKSNSGSTPANPSPPSDH